MSKWISTEERLPRKEGDYLIATSDGKISIAPLIEFYDDDRGGFYMRFCHEWYRPREITHWMYLPNKPRG